MKRLCFALGGLVLGAASLMGCHRHHGYWHDPYAYHGHQGCCAYHTAPAPYCNACCHYHAGACH